MDTERAKNYPGAKQKLLVTMAKVSLQRKKKRLAKLKQEVFYLEKFLCNSELVTAQAKGKKLIDKTMAKLKYGQKHKRDMLKAVMGSEV